MKLLLTSIATLSLSISNLWSFDQNHEKLTTLVSKTASPAGVKYKELKKQHTEIKTYLKELAAVEYATFKEWKTPDQLAFLVNLYNASTLNLVLDHYPIKSLKDEVGGKDGPWKIGSVKMFGKTTTLDVLEHQFIRKYYDEPRVHFALNCASEGCPPLRNEAFTGAKLEQQLEDQTKTFLANSKANSLSGNDLKISPLFDWFKDDFTKKSGSVEAFLNPYFADKKITKGSVKISYTDYGWSLNEVK